MYQYSLVYYIDLFTAGILNSEKSADFEKRLLILKDYFVYSLYSNICRSLFEKDKIVFSMLLTCRLLIFRNQMEAAHLRFVITGGTLIIDNPPEKPENTPWISQKAWSEIIKLSREKDFNEEGKEFYTWFSDKQFLREMKEIYDANEAHLVPLPSQIREKYSSFHYLMILRTIRPDKLIPAIINYITEQMGKKVPSFVIFSSFFFIINIKLVRATSSFRFG